MPAFTVKADAVAVCLVGFDLEGLHDPHGEVADDEESYELPARFLHQLATRAAPAEAVDDKWRLDDHLDQLEDDDYECHVTRIDHGWDGGEDAVEQKWRDADEQEKIVQQWDRMGVDG